MKKSLLALAVLGAFAGAASAQTNVTVYGVIDAGVQYTNNGDKTKWALDSGLQSGSRIGFKGTEDLGGGLSAIFTLENGFYVDDGSMGVKNESKVNDGKLFGRQAWVGLKGAFGEVKLGRQQTPLYYAVAAIDPFAIGLAGNALKAFGDGAYNFDPATRTDNTVSYAINTNGFNAGLNYGFGEQAGDNKAGRNIGLGLGYANGPINVQYAYQQAKVVDPTKDDDSSANFIGGTYDFGVAKAHAAYARNKFGDVRNTNWLLGASAPVGTAGTVMASWIRNDYKDADATKSNQYALGYTHSLSKRTNLYTSLAYIKNDDNANLGAAAAADGKTVKVLNVGVRHAF